jgi:deoxyribose-phosphate aldolase
MNMTPQELAQYIDHTILRADATAADIDLLCEEARTFQFYSVCVNSRWIARCHQQLTGSPVHIAAVVGFPLGAMDAEVKAAEARRSVELGATELDMVLSVGSLKEGDMKTVAADIRAVRNAAPKDIVLKVILETCLLTEEQKITACRLSQEEGADFVKTSTGFSTGGATVADIALMRRTVGPTMGVKASGGVRTRETAQAMIAAGATRIGASASIAIIRGDAP